MASFTTLNLLCVASSSGVINEFSFGGTKVLIRLGGLILRGEPAVESSLSKDCPGTASNWLVTFVFISEIVKISYFTHLCYDFNKLRTNLN